MNQPHGLLGTELIINIVIKCAELGRNAQHTSRDLVSHAVFYVRADLVVARRDLAVDLRVEVLGQVHGVGAVLGVEIEYAILEAPLAHEALHLKLVDHRVVDNRVSDVVKGHIANVFEKRVASGALELGADLE